MMLRFRNSFQAKNQIQSSVRKIRSKDEAKAIYCKVPFKIPERFKGHHQQFQTVEQPLQTLKSVNPAPPSLTGSLRKEASIEETCGYSFCLMEQIINGFT